MKTHGVSQLQGIKRISILLDLVITRVRKGGGVTKSEKRKLVFFSSVLCTDRQALCGETIHSWGAGGSERWALFVCIKWRKAK